MTNETVRKLRHFAGENFDSTDPATIAKLERIRKILNRWHTSQRETRRYRQNTIAGNSLTRLGY